MKGERLTLMFSSLMRGGVKEITAMKKGGRGEKERCKKTGCCGWKKKKKKKREKSLALFSLELVLIKKDWFYVTAGGERQFTANMFRQTKRERKYLSGWFCLTLCLTQVLDTECTCFMKANVREATKCGQKSFLAGRKLSLSFWFDRLGLL